MAIDKLDYDNLHDDIVPEYFELDELKAIYKTTKEEIVRSIHNTKSFNE